MKIVKALVLGFKVRPVKRSKRIKNIHPAFQLRAN